MAVVSSQDVLDAAAQLLGVEARRGQDNHITGAYRAYFDRTLQQYSQGLPANIEPWEGRHGR